MYNWTFAQFAGFGLAAFLVFIGLSVLLHAIKAFQSKPGDK